MARGPAWNSRPPTGSSPRSSTAVGTAPLSFATLPSRFAACYAARAARLRALSPRSELTRPGLCQPRPQRHHPRVPGLREAPAACRAGNPLVITKLARLARSLPVHERTLGNLAEPDRRRVRALQRGYVEIWVDVLRRVVPGTPEPTARAAAHAVFGLLNSTPRSTYLERDAMAELLRRMALGALVSPGVLA